MAVQPSVAIEQEDSVDQTTIPLSGPRAIEHALGKLDITGLETEYRNVVKSGLKSKRPKAVKALNVIEGLKRNNMEPKNLLIQQVPVIPPAFRPFSVVGDTFAPGPANELYRDLFKYRDAYDETYKLLGERGSRDARLDLYDSVKALYGFGDPIAPKTKQRGVSGFLKQVTGTSPKFSFFQNKLIGKPQDSVSRGTISIDPELSMDEIGVPENMAWTMYADYVQRRLVRAGMSPRDAVKEVANRSQQAKNALTKELEERPVIYSRSPSWHKFNIIAGRPKLIEGDTIRVNPMITTGMNADFDGDAMNLHVPSMPEAVKEAWEKLMPSKMLFSIRDQNRVVPNLKHELILGLYTADKRPSKNKFVFRSESDAIRAIKAGEVKLSDDIEILQ